MGSLLVWFWPWSSQSGMVKSVGEQTARRYSLTDHANTQAPPPRQSGEHVGVFLLTQRKSFMNYPL